MPLTCDSLIKQGRRRNVIALVPRIDVASRPESPPAFVTAEITHELSRAWGLSFRFV